MGAVIRGGLIVIGLLLMLAGLGLVVVQAPEIEGLRFAALQLVAMGAFLVVIVVIERHRYRSDHAERTNAPAGPGGGEPLGALEARFKPTSEVFVDPVTRQRMRVVIDPTNGERRYIADG